MHDYRKDPPKIKEKTYQANIEMLRSWGYQEKTPFEFYSVLFSGIPTCAESHAHAKTTDSQGKPDFACPQPILTIVTDGTYASSHPEEKNALTKYCTKGTPIFADTLEKELQKTTAYGLRALMAPVLYIGYRQADTKHAQKLLATVIDLDYVGQNELINLNNSIIECNIPTPTYIVLSGTGAHLYYALMSPIELYNNSAYRLRLSDFRSALTDLVSVYGKTSGKEEADHLAITQQFRVVGSKNGKYGTDKLVVRAFKSGGKVSVDYLNSFLPTEKRFQPAETKTRQPERCVDTKESQNDSTDKKAAPKKHIPTSIDFYNYMISQACHIRPGHRYNYVKSLAAAAQKCNVSKDQFMRDCDSLFDILSADRDTPFTREDLECAEKCYDSPELYKYKSTTIEKLCGIKFRRKNRNPKGETITRKEAMNNAREVLADRNAERHRAGKKALQGRKEKGVIVPIGKEDHPFGTISQCVVELHLSRRTVQRWWNTGL